MKAPNCESAAIGQNLQSMDLKYHSKVSRHEKQGVISFVLRPHFLNWWIVPPCGHQGRLIRVQLCSKCRERFGTILLEAGIKSTSSQVDIGHQNILLLAVY
jgi:hypothetical protein